MHGLTFDELMTELFTERWSSLKTQSGYAMCVRVMKRHIKTDYPAEVTKQQVLAWRATVVKRPGRPDESYRFRHSFATELMAGDNADIHLTQLLMGHSDIRSTMVYVDVPVDKLRSYLMQRSEA